MSIFSFVVYTSALRLFIRMWRYCNIFFKTVCSSVPAASLTCMLSLDMAVAKNDWLHIRGAIKEAPRMACCLHVNFSRGLKMISRFCESIIRWTSRHNWNQGLVGRTSPRYSDRGGRYQRIKSGQLCMARTTKVDWSSTRRSHWYSQNCVRFWRKNK